MLASVGGTTTALNKDGNANEKDVVESTNHHGRTAAPEVALTTVCTTI